MGLPQNICSSLLRRRVGTFGGKALEGILKLISQRSLGHAVLVGRVRLEEVAVRRTFATGRRPISGGGKASLLHIFIFRIPACRYGRLKINVATFANRRCGGAAKICEIWPHPVIRQPPKAGQNANSACPFRRPSAVPVPNKASSRRSDHEFYVLAIPPSFAPSVRGAPRSCRSLLLRLCRHRSRPVPRDPDQCRRRCCVALCCRHGL